MILTTSHQRSIKEISLILLLLISTMYVQAQQTAASFDIYLKEATLKEFAAEIEKKSGYSFIYGEEVVLEHPITLNLKNASLHVILQKAFAGQNISFQLNKGHIILKKSTPPPGKPSFTINGYIIDSISKETLIGANVYASPGKAGTTTNPFGYFSITLPEGDARLQFSYIGYTTRQLALHLCKDTLLTIRLHNDNQLDEVVILSDKPETGIRSSRMGATTVPIPHIKNTPALMSEADVLKSIQLLPGVQSGMSGTCGIHVRGGGPDQNLYLLDGVPLYNVDHTLGLLSVFAPEAVKKVDLYKSSFPARYGGRLSSIVDVRTNDGDMQHYHGSFTIGLLTSHLQFEGPIWKDRTSFLVSARRSYIDCFLPLVMSKDERGGYNLYDINAKLNHRFSEQDRLFVSFYKGRDHVYYKYKDESTYKQTHDWGNMLLSTRWNHVFTPQLFSNTTLAYSRYLFDIKHEETSRLQRPDAPTITQAFDNLFHSGIKDLSVSTDFDYHPSPAHSIKWGGKYIYHQFAPEVQTMQQYHSGQGQPQTNNNYNLTHAHVYAHDASLYAEDDLTLNERWKMNAGLHFSFFNVQSHNYLSLQPRLSVSFQAAKHFILKSSFSQMNQCSQLLSSASLAMPSDLWVPVTRHIRPMKSFQYAAGMYYTGLKHWEFSIEGYYKDMHNVLEYKDGESYLGSSRNWEDKVEMGKGRSFGIELMAQKTAGRLTGWINYTWSKSDRQFSADGINNGKRFPYQYDRRHALNLALNYQLSRRIDFNATWTYASGCMTTLPKEKTHVQLPAINTPWFIENLHNGDIDHYGPRNNYRLPASHQLNLGFNFHKKTRHGERIWNVSVLNAYNAMNPNFVYISRESQTRKPVLKKMTILPCIPSFSYTYKF